MARRGWIAASAVVALLVACGVESVTAKDYDQSCKTSGDCILVEELQGTSDNKCTISCTKGAINRNAKDKYDKEYSEEAADCVETTQPECTAAQAAICKDGKCTAATLTDVALDAGGD